MSADRNFALIGQRKLAKTSIILEHLSRNPDPQSLIAYGHILFEGTPPPFARKGLRALLISIESARGGEVDHFSRGEDLAARAIQALPVIGQLTAERAYSIIQMVVDTPST